MAKYIECLNEALAAVTCSVTIGARISLTDCLLVCKPIGAKAHRLTLYSQCLLTTYCLLNIPGTQKLFVVNLHYRNGSPV